MAMVFNRDVLFIHVPKTGGVSVTNYLLQVLPTPVWYVTNAPIGQLSAREGVSFIAGQAHQTLATARTFLPRHGFELERFPRILAAIRNPYDLAVSFYTYKRSPQVEFTLLDAAAPHAPSSQTRTAPGQSRLQDAFEEALTKLKPGTVGRFEPTGSETVGQLQKELHRVAVDQAQPAETWTHEGVLYATLKIRPAKTFRNVHLSRQLDFPQFLQVSTSSRRRNFLSSLAKYYFLEDAMPTNLRILRFERLADEVREALGEIGITGNADFPWLNRSEHGPYVDFYDTQSERRVYEASRWLFDHGYYERLDPPCRR